MSLAYAGAAVVIGGDRRGGRVRGRLHPARADALGRRTHAAAGHQRGDARVRAARDVRRPPVDLRGSLDHRAAGACANGGAPGGGMVLPVLRAIDPRQREAPHAGGVPGARLADGGRAGAGSRARGGRALAAAVSLGEFGATSFLARPAADPSSGDRWAPGCSTPDGLLWRRALAEAAWAKAAALAVAVRE